MNGAPVDGGECLPTAAYAMALAHLPGVGPAWLTAAMERYGPEEAWQRVRSGDLARPPAPGSRGRRRPGLAGRATAAASAAREEWAPWAARFDIAGRWRQCLESAISVLWLGGPGYPAALVPRPSPAGVLFVAGSSAAVGVRPAVAIIGTRDCTPEGAAVAFELAYELALRGVEVVSGLALGIDGAAHAGVVTACREAPSASPTVGIAASGVDVVYPSRHAGLWREVTRTGAIVSEAPPGSPAQSWRFPSRNRVIAGLVNAVIVVECHARGGSWHTVNTALREGTEVGVVPGSVRNPAAFGTNLLLSEGATLIRNTEDVLVMLDRIAARVEGRGVADDAPEGAGQRLAFGPPPETTPKHELSESLGPVERHVLAALSGRPMCFDDIVERSGLPPAAAVVALEHLVERGTAAEEGGWWTRM